MFTLSKFDKINANQNKINEKKIPYEINIARDWGRKFKLCDTSVFQLINS